MVPRLATVERGRAGVDETFKEPFDPEGRAEIRVLWDHRQAERHQPAPRRPLEALSGNRRRAERRGPPPAIWTSLNFVRLPASPHLHADRRAS